MGKKLTEDDMIKWCEEHPDSPQYVTGYKDTRTKCTFICPICREEFDADPHSIKSKNTTKCRKCRYEHVNDWSRMTERKYIEKLESLNFSHPIYKIGFESRDKKCIHICPDCFSEFVALPKTVVIGAVRRCDKCNRLKTSKRMTMSESEYIGKLSTIELAPKYIEGFVNTKTKCKHICPYCNEIFMTIPNNVIQGKVRRCVECSNKLRESEGALIVEAWLKNNGYSYEKEKTFEGCEQKKKTSVRFLFAENKRCNRV